MLTGKAVDVRRPVWRIRWGVYSVRFDERREMNERRTSITVYGWLLVVLLVSAARLVQADPVGMCEHGKTQLVFPGDPFEVRQYAGMSNLGWVKFTLLNPPHDPNVVYFQDGERFPLHYNFVSGCLDPFVGIGPQEFDRISLHAENQQVILGAVITPPAGYGVSAPIPEYGVQFVRHDPFTREEIVTLFRKVTAAISSDPNVVPYYFPAFEQSQVAQGNAAWFAEQGIPIGSTARWVRGNAIYSEGWALGRLKYVESNEIDLAYQRGDLRADDILLTDAVPAEIPVLAGVVSLTPSTPNSHVAILANTYAIPFVHLAEGDDRQGAFDLEGRRIVLRAYDSYWRVNADTVGVQLEDANDTMTDEQAAEFLSLKQPPTLSIQPVEHLGDYSASVDMLQPEDIRYFGGKAANYSILRRAIREHSRQALAFSFDLWNAFLDQTLANGHTLRAEIGSRLSGYNFPPASAAALSHELEQVRELIKDDGATRFSPVLREAVIAALTDPAHGLDPNRKIRFRSSTNVEDSEHFSGAGLYDSFSGCLADDLDDDDSGPSHCDSDKRKERGVFRAIRKVFASFYNDNAFTERLRHGLSEDEVGMALLVHHSFPDEIELANGVAVLEINTYGMTAEIVTQGGAMSVANPEPGLIPEEVTASTSLGSDDVYVRVGSYSNLTPLGQTVMTWSDDYKDLMELLVQAAQQFERDTGRKPKRLDFEYKKIAPEGKLVVKQIREIPTASGAAAKRRFLAGGSVRLSVLQSEYSEPLALHRLKCDWQLESGSHWLTAEELDVCLFQGGTMEYQDEGQIWTTSGSLASWPEAQHGLVKPETNQDIEMTDSWTFDHLENARRYTLTTRIGGTGVVPDECPVLFLSDLTYRLAVKYAEPVLAWDWMQDGAVTSTTTDEVRLVPALEPDRDDLLQYRQIVDDGITVETSYFWPPPPTGPTAGYTAPLSSWVETVVTGLTAEPFTLRSPYAQTYSAGHHNFFERFLLEPRLDPDLPETVRGELRAKGVDLISASTGFGEAAIETYDLVDMALPPEDSAPEQQ